MSQPGIVSKRGTYCESAVPDGSYHRAHDCLIRYGIKKYRGVYLCPHHRKAKDWA